MSFKIAHLSDWHAGYRSGRRTTAEGVNIREQDGYDVIHIIVDEVIAEGCDAAVFAGDTMHLPEPDIRALITVQAELRRLAEAGVKVYMLAGNHETSDIQADIASSRLFDDRWRGIYSHAEPYVAHEIAPGVHLHLVSHHMYGEQAETMKLVQPTQGEINIFSTHGSVIDPILEMKLSAEQSPREIVIPDFLLEDYGWDYIMLGHIHERGWVGSKDKKTDTGNTKIFYNGSAIRRGFADKEAPLGRGWTLWTVESDGTFTPEIREVQQRTQIDFDPIDCLELSSAEITDMIIEKLRSTQEDGRKFIPATAPLLRQKLTNLSPSKHTGLDWRSIDQESQHALHWDLNPVAGKTKPSPDKKQEGAKGTDNDPSNIVDLYDTWVENSAKLSETAKDLQERVKKHGRGHIQTGVEVVLNEQ